MKSILFICALAAAVVMVAVYSKTRDTITAERTRAECFAALDADLATPQADVSETTRLCAQRGIITLADVRARKS